MQNKINSYGQRFLLLIVFCALNAAFFFLAWKVYEWQSPRYRALKLLQPPQASAGFKRALFSPDDSIQDLLITLIDEEKEYIAMAAFSLTSFKVAEALIQAAKRGVTVELVVDEQNSQTPHSKVCMIYNHIPTIWVYPSQKMNRRSSRSSIMHHKFIVFKKSLNNASLLWTGSFNFTRSAHEVNQENVIILDDLAFITAFLKQFEILKRRSIAMAHQKAQGACVT